MQHENSTPSLAHTDSSTQRRSLLLNREEFPELHEAFYGSGGVGDEPIPMGTVESEEVAPHKERKLGSSSTARRKSKILKSLLRAGKNHGHGHGQGQGEARETSRTENEKPPPIPPKQKEEDELSQASEDNLENYEDVDVDFAGLSSDDFETRKSMQDQTGSSLKSAGRSISQSLKKKLNDATHSSNVSTKLGMRQISRMGRKNRGEKEGKKEQRLRHKQEKAAEKKAKKRQKELEEMRKREAAKQAHLASKPGLSELRQFKPSRDVKSPRGKTL